MKRTLTVLLAGLVLAIALPMASSTAAGSSSCWTYQNDEKGFAAKMNAARSLKGLGNVSLDPELSKVARLHTKEMVRADKLHHTDTSALKRRVTNWVSLGENVGVGGTVTSLHSAFMASPTHKDNILFPSFNHVGIGTKKVDGQLWVTVVFEARTNPGTTLAMPSC